MRGKRDTAFVYRYLLVWRVCSYISCGCCWAIHRRRIVLGQHTMLAPACLFLFEHHAPQVAAFTANAAPWPLGSGSLPPLGFPYRPTIQPGSTVVQGPLQLRPPSLDVDGLGFALQGESLRVAVVIAAPDPLHRCSLAVEAQYADATAVAEVVAVGGLTVGGMELGSVEGSRSVPVDVTLPSEGEVTVNVVLTYCTSKVGVCDPMCMPCSPL